jgi:cell cycle sensor histidine kinase DivJ
VGLLKSIRDYVDTLVHPSALTDALTASRHRAFIAPRLLGSLVALAAFPVYLAMRGAPSALEVLVFAWLVLPILTAYYLSRTGQYESAHVLSSLALTGLVTAVAAKPAASNPSPRSGWWWCRSRPRCRPRAAWSHGIDACAAVRGLLISSALGAAAADRKGPALAGALAALGIISAALYATGLALRRRIAGAHQLLAALRRGRSLSPAGAQHDRRDHAARPQRRGAVHFAGGGDMLFGAKVNELHGHGLFDRVHVADRPAYLTALADAARCGEARSVEFRVRRAPATRPRPANRTAAISSGSRCAAAARSGAAARPARPRSSR